MMRVAEQNASDRPTISVAVITYNHEQFIAQAIESVLMQETAFVVELIIGEDCSTDGTRRIVQAYAAKYPNVIRALLPEKNLGMARNYDAVWQSCRGKYIAWLEGDDYWRTPQKLQKQVALMEANPHYSMCGTTTQFVSTSSDGAEKDAGELEPAVLKLEYDLSDFLTHYPMHTSSMLLRREFVEFPDWLNGLVMLRDTCVFALCAEKGPVGYLSEVVSCWRIHPGGLWTTKSETDQLQCNQKAIDLLDAHFGGRYHRLLRMREYQVWRRALRSLAESGKYREARRLYWESASRLVQLTPLKVLALGCAVYGGYWCLHCWNRLTMLLAIRTRVRRLIGRGSQRSYQRHT
ncbi:MAG TPA: glycosyltransferase family 2 protein [Candidatus Udaeobacter sp.]